MGQEVVQFYVSLWNSLAFRKLRSQGKRDAMNLGAYLVTSPQSNPIGIFKFDFEMAAELTMIQQELLIDCLADLAFYDFLTFDRDTAVVWVHPVGQYQHNLGTRQQLSVGDKRVEGVKRLISRVESDLIAELFTARYNWELRMNIPKQQVRGEAEIRREGAGRLIGPAPEMFEQRGVR